MSHTDRCPPPTLDAPGFPPADHHPWLLQARGGLSSLTHMRLLVNLFASAQSRPSLDCCIIVSSEVRDAHHTACAPSALRPRADALPRAVCCAVPFTEQVPGVEQLQPRGLSIPNQTPGTRISREPILTPQWKGPHLMSCHRLQGH